MKITSQARHGLYRRTAAGLVGVLVLAACASVPPAPDSALQAARMAISNAERIDAGHYASGELAEARTKLASAETAVKAESMVMAERLAEESRAAAEAASAKTAATKAKAVNDEMKRSTDILVEEMQRGSGESQ